MSFFDLASYDFRVSWPTAFILIGFIALILSGLFATLIVKWKSKVAKASVIVGTVASTVIFILFLLYNTSIGASEFKATQSANAKVLEEYALNDYGVELTVTEVSVLPKSGSSSEYVSPVSPGKTIKVPVSGLTVATAVDPETRTAYSFDANKDHEIVLLKNGEPVELKKSQSAKG